MASTIIPLTGGVSSVRPKTSYDRLKDAARILQADHPDIKLNAGTEALVRDILRYNPSLLPEEFKTMGAPGSVGSIVSPRKSRSRAVSPPGSVKGLPISSVKPVSPTRGRPRTTSPIRSPDRGVVEVKTYIPGQGFSTQTIVSPIRGRGRPRKEVPSQIVGIPLNLPSATSVQPVGIPLNLPSTTSVPVTLLSPTSPRMTTARTSPPPPVLSTSPGRSRRSNRLVSPTRLENIQTVENGKFLPSRVTVSTLSPLRSETIMTTPVVPILSPSKIRGSPVQYLPTQGPVAPVSLVSPTSGNIMFTPTIPSPTLRPSVSAGVQEPSGFQPSSDLFKIQPEPNRVGGTLSGSWEGIESGRMLKYGEVIGEEAIKRGFRLPDPSGYNLGHTVILMGQNWTVVLDERTGQRVWRLHLQPGSPLPSVRGYSLGDIIEVGVDKYRIDKPGRKKVWVKF